MCISFKKTVIHIVSHTYMNMIFFQILFTYRFIIRY